MVSARAEASAGSQAAIRTRGSGRTIKWMGTAATEWQVGVPLLPHQSRGRPHLLTARISYGWSQMAMYMRARGSMV